MNAITPTRLNIVAAAGLAIGEAFVWPACRQMSRQALA
jgi:hypothetical protein